MAVIKAAIKYRRLKLWFRDEIRVFNANDTYSTVLRIFPLLMGFQCGKIKAGRGEVDFPPLPRASALKQVGNPFRKLMCGVEKAQYSADSTEPAHKLFPSLV